MQRRSGDSKARRTLASNPGRLLSAAVTALVVTIGWVATLHASNAFFVSLVGADTNDCLTLASACRTVAAAVGKASAGDIVIIADGTYTENLHLDRDVTILGFGQNVTTISGGGISRIMTVTNSASVTIANLTLTNGAGGAPLYAAGILVSGTLRAARTTLTGTNDIAIRNDGSFEGHDLTISHNSSGVYNAGVATLTQSIIENNSVGIRNYGTLRLHDSAVLSHTAGTFPGAGIANYGALEIDRSVIRGNWLTDSRGAGIYNAGVLSVSNSLVLSNTAYYPVKPPVENAPQSFAALGGGIYNENWPPGVLTVTNSTLAGNSANTGGDQLGNGGTAWLINVTLSGDDGHHGVNTGQNMTLINVTISDMPSGVGTSPGTSARNVIVNNAPCIGTMTSLGHNLESGNTCGFTATGDLTNTNPLLGPLQDNGGPTPTHALLPGSPAINAGDNTHCPATDQRGVPRPQAGRCDIGAYEYVFPVETYLPFVAR